MTPPGGLEPTPARGHLIPVKCPRCGCPIPPLAQRDISRAGLESKNPSRMAETVRIERREDPFDAPPGAPTFPVDLA